jgi:xanthosine utilization system XapX-like protein
MKNILFAAVLTIGLGVSALLSLAQIPYPNPNSPYPPMLSMIGIPIWQVNVQTAELHVPIIIDGVK